MFTLKALDWWVFSWLLSLTYFCVVFTAWLIPTSLLNSVNSFDTVILGFIFLLWSTAPPHPVFPKSMFSLRLSRFSPFQHLFPISILYQTSCQFREVKCHPDLLSTLLDENFNYICLLGFIEHLLCDCFYFKYLHTFHFIFGKSYKAVSITIFIGKEVNLSHLVNWSSRASDSRFQILCRPIPMPREKTSEHQV